MTRENYVEGRDDEDDVSLGSAAKASSSVLAGRKIIKPRSRAGAGNGVSSGFSFGASASKPTAFGGVSATQSSTNSNPFGSLRSNAGSSGSETAATSADSVPISGNSHKIRALNEKFIERLNRLILPNTVADLRPIANKYLQYYKQIEQEELSASIPKASEPPTNGFSFGTVSKPSAEFNVKPVVAPIQAEKKNVKPAEPQVVSIDVDSESSESEDDVKIEGPKFTLSNKPVAKNSPFSFGPKKEKKPSSDSDSESEIEIKGPSFTFNKPIKDAVFKFAGSENKNTPSFGTNTSSEKPAESSTEKNAASGPNAESKPAFSFGTTSFGGAAEQKEALKPTFLFGSTTSGSGSFGFKAAEQPDQGKPALSFGFPAADKDKKVEAPAATTFSFNPPAAKDTGSKTGFSFNPAPSAQKEAEPSTAVSFGSTSTSKPFSFGATEKKSEDKPSFSFNPSTEKKETVKPAFSFGGEKKEDAKPAFSFVSEKKENTTPALSFGSTPLQGGLFGSAPKSDSSTPKPFSFGSNTGTQTSTGFGSGLFGKAPENGQKAASTFSFGASAPSGSVASASGTDSAIETPLDLVPEEETGGDFKPVASLSSEKVETSETGEENDEVLYTKKTKLMLFDPSNKESPYANKGLGDLKILKAKDSGKSRILIRADGGLRVLLNSLVNKDMTYSTIGNGSMVRVPVVNADKSIETYVLRVKTPADGEELLASLNAAK